MSMAKNEWEKIKINMVTGTTANTDIALTGITTADELIAVHGFDPDHATAASQVVDFTTNATITAANTIQLDVDSTGYDLQVFWVDKDAG